MKFFHIHDYKFERKLCEFYEEGVGWTIKNKYRCTICNKTKVRMVK